MSNAPQEIALEYLKRLSLAFRGLSASYIDLLSPDVLVTIPGSTPISGAVHGLDALADLGAKVGAFMTIDPEFNIFVERVVAEGEKVAILARGRGEAASGRPYNNQYLFFFRIVDGKIVELFENCDSATINWAIFNKDYVQRRKEACR